MVGSNQGDDHFRVLKIDRTAVTELNVTDDEVVYSKQEVLELLSMIEDGNRSSGGLHKVTAFFGIVGTHLARESEIHIAPDLKSIFCNVL